MQNFPTLIRTPAVRVIEYDLRAQNLVKVQLEAQQAVPDCKDSFELAYSCKLFDDCSSLDENLFKVIPVSDNLWEMQMYTSDY